MDKHSHFHWSLWNYIAGAFFFWSNSWDSTVVHCSHLWGYCLRAVRLGSAGWSICLVVVRRSSHRNRLRPGRYSINHVSVAQNLIHVNHAGLIQVLRRYSWRCMNHKWWTFFKSTLVLHLDIRCNLLGNACPESYTFIFWTRFSCFERRYMCSCRWCRSLFC